MRFSFLLILVVCIGTANLFSSNNKNIEAKNKAKQKLSTFKEADFIKLHPPKNISEEKQILINKTYQELIEQKKITPISQSNNNGLRELPAKFRVPGEFEELQAVLISWPSYAFDENGEYLEPFTPGKGFQYYQDDTGQWQTRLVDIEGFVLDLEYQSPYSDIWAKLANIIQKETQVWIRIAAPEDTTLLKTFLMNKGVNLTNYKFKFDEDGENAFWMRDFGPFGAYYGDKDSLMFVIAEYYPGRPIDDNYPVKLAQELGYKYYKSPVELEGGNYMTDGHGMGFYSEVVYSNNSDIYGPAYTEKAPMSSAQVNAEMAKIFNISTPVILPMLRCDGGTGHIDLYTKMANDEEILITKFPDVFNKFQFPDYNTVKSNREKMLDLQTKFGKKYKFLEVPLPTDDDGKYNRTTCNTFTEDARTYINGLTVNKTFIVPTYSSSSSGNSLGDEEALNAIRKVMPGYNVVGIDSRVLTVGGGAVHCITMQIPAENPVYIQHSQIKGLQIESELVNDNKVKISGIVRNHSGIKNAILNYRCKKNGNSWESSVVEISTANTGSESDFNFNSFIELSKISCGYNSDIDYFLTFETNNGKTAYKPIVAPDGYYTFSIGDPTSVNDDKPIFTEIFPNPANDVIRINLSNDLTTYEIDLSNLKIFNTIGLDVTNQLSFNVYLNSIEVNLSTLDTGVYFVHLGNKVAKFIKI